MSLKQLLLSCLIIWIAQIHQANAQKSKNLKPNIVYILADDLGYGDLSCYGQQKFKTPNIDKLAAEGMLFTQHYSGYAVCAPSRCCLMTGQSTGHAYIRGNREFDKKTNKAIALKDSIVTVAEMLKNAGYATGMFGKWGLGNQTNEGDPNKQGFDEFYGFNDQVLAHNYFPSFLCDNGKEVILDGNVEDKNTQYAPLLIHNRALQFIEKNNPAKTGKPFFMYYPSTIPHAELLIPEEYLKEFRGKLLPEKEFKGLEPGSERFRKGGLGSQKETHAAFGAMITLLDKQVGEIVSKLKELGLDKNTIILFSSDNGPHKEGGGDPDFFNSNGPFRGIKRDLYDGGMHVPFIVRYPQKIKAGTTSNLISAFWDVMPTLAEIAETPSPQNLDGISFLPTLLGSKSQKLHESLYWEGAEEAGGKQAIRKGDWKLVRNNMNDPKLTTTELYNLKTDIGEQNNVADKNPELVKELLDLIQKSRTPSSIYKFRFEKN